MYPDKVTSNGYGFTGSSSAGSARHLRGPPPDYYSSTSQGCGWFKQNNDQSSSSSWMPNIASAGAGFLGGFLFGSRDNTFSLRSRHHRHHSPYPTQDNFCHQEPSSTFYDRHDSDSDRSPARVRHSDSPNNANSTTSNLGPVLWADNATFDLDDINLAEFSPTLLDDLPSIRSNQTIAGSDEFTKSNSSDSDKSSDKKKPRTRRAEPSITTPPRTRTRASNSFSTDSSASVKSPKPRSTVPSDLKNEAYWRRRMQNNASAKRSRDARRQMESQVYAKASLLEVENLELKSEIERLRNENKYLSQLLNSSNASLTSHPLSINTITNSPQPSIALTSPSSNYSLPYSYNNQQSSINNHLSPIGSLSPSNSTPLPQSTDDLLFTFGDPQNPHHVGSNAVGNSLLLPIDSL